jgi:hypothetical protein
MRIAVGELHSGIWFHCEEETMLNVKLLVGSSALAAGVWKVWTSTGPLSLMLQVLCALVVSWAIFVAVIYLTAAHLRRTPLQSRTPRPMTPSARITRDYVTQFKRGAR